jgi:hypothetical protein
MYTAKILGDKRIIQGSYIPKGHTCKCKSCKFTIEVPKGTTDEHVKAIIELITK